MDSPRPLDMAVVAWCSLCDELTEYDCRCRDTSPAPAPAEALAVEIPYRDPRWDDVARLRRLAEDAARDGDEVFPGAAKTIIPARFKTKVGEGALFLTLELLGVKQMIEAAFQDAIRKVEGYTALPIYRAALAA